MICGMRVSGMGPSENSSCRAVSDVDDWRCPRKSDADRHDRHERQAFGQRVAQNRQKSLGLVGIGDAEQLLGLID